MQHIHLARAAQRALAPIDGFTQPGATELYPPDLGLEPKHLALDLWLDIPARTLSGRATYTVQCNRAGETVLELDAVGLLDVSVAVGEATVSNDGTRVRLAWRSGLALGESRTVTLAWRAVVPVAGLYFSSPDDVEPDRPTFVATDNETERARYWMPCVDHPAVRPTLSFDLRAPSALTALANGVETGRVDHEDGTSTTSYRLEHGCPSYLTCFVVGALIRADDRAADGVPIAYFTTPGFTDADLRRSFGRTPDMLEWITRRLDSPYPFPKYFQVALAGIGGAMENISLVSWDDRFVLDETLASEWGALVDQINIHEMAHTWFGDAIVCRDFAHAWLKESWATYIETVWMEETISREEADYNFHEDCESYFSEADGRYKRPLVTRTLNSSWQMYDMHLYPGGACRLHTLRHELGDAVFWEGVRRYVRRYSGQVVETDHFRHVMEEVSGRSLGRFFDTWIHSPGYPHIKASWAFDKARGQGTLTLEQTQVDPKASIPVFDLQLDVSVVVDGKVHERRVRMDQPRAQVVLPCADAPEQVRIDPHAHVLMKLDFNPGDDLLKAQLRRAPDVVGRIRAARELARTGLRANLDALAEAYRTEPFWGVRVWIARSLREAATQVAVDHLCALLAFEQDPRVLEPLIRAAGAFRDRGVRAAIEARLLAGMGYRARAAAYEALGSQRAEAPIDTLLDAANQPSFGGWTQQGALMGLAASRQRTAYDALSRLVGSVALAPAARPWAARALGEAARYAEKLSLRAAMVEQLIDLLRDPVARVRQGAVAGLQTAGDGRAIDALESYARAIPPQEAVAVRAAIAAIHRAESSSGRGDDRVEKLEQLVRTLQRTIDDLGARLEPPAPGERKKRKKK